MTNDFTYMKIYFTDGTELVIPQGRVIVSNETELAIEEAGEETFLVMKASMKYVFAGKPE